MVRGRRFRERLGRVTFQATVAGAFVFMVLPIALVLWLSFFRNEILSLPPEGYSLRWYSEMFAQRQFISGFWTSLEVALLATACGLLVTTPASFALTRSRFRGREAFLQLLMSPLIVPAIVIGASLYMSFVEFEVLTGLPVVGSVWGLAIGHVLITIPWSMRLITANGRGASLFALKRTPFASRTWAAPTRSARRPRAARRVGHNSAVLRIRDDKDRNQSRTSRPTAYGAPDENKAVEAMADNRSANVGERKRARGGYPQARDRAARQLGKCGA